MFDGAIVYTQNNCKYCQIVKNYLDDKGIKYIARNLDDPERGAEYKEEHKAFGFQTVPITLLKGKTIVGFDLRKFNQLVAE